MTRRGAGLQPPFLSRVSRTARRGRPRTPDAVQPCAPASCSSCCPAGQRRRSAPSPSRPRRGLPLSPEAARAALARVGAEVPRGRTATPFPRRRRPRSSRAASASWARACARARPAPATPWTPLLAAGVQGRPPDARRRGRPRQQPAARGLPCPRAAARTWCSTAARSAASWLRWSPTSSRVQTAEFLITANRGDGEAGPARPHDRALRPRRARPGAEDAPSASAAGR